MATRKNGIRLMGFAIALTVLAVPSHAQRDALPKKWQVGFGSGYVAVGGLSDVAQGLALHGFLANRLGSRVDLRIGVNVSGHGYSAVDVPGGDRRLDFPLFGSPTYEFLTMYGGPVIWLRSRGARLAPYVGAMVAGVGRLDGDQMGLGINAATGLLYWWTRRFGVEVGLNAMLSRLRWTNTRSYPRYQNGRFASLTIGAVVGIAR